MPWGKRCASFDGSSCKLSSKILTFSVQTAVIWAIFSSSVMRESRSSTRDSMEAFASLYSGRAPVDAGAAATGAAGGATASVSRETRPNSLRNRIKKQEQKEDG